MRVRVLKTPPAYVIDGFDVRSLRSDHVYDLDTRMANYLVVAGYAVRMEDERSNPPAPQQAGKTGPSTST
jgi:hypothetical protein